MSMSRAVPIIRCGPEGETTERDEVVLEEPLEIRLDGHPIAVVMRTPGHDEELTAGFLITEGIISSLSQLRRIEVRPEENRALAFLADDVRIDATRFTRHCFTGSSCGICGKATLEAVLTRFPKIQRAVRISADILLDAPGKLLSSQSTFQTTGGLHAAGIFSQSGALLVSREDIGRHNAVDKAIGHALRHGIDLSATFLLLSGRVSFEIMQKALAVRIPAIAAISAPSSLAVEFARESGQTLVGFLRPPTFNRYA
jgi:FdhD protein